MSCCCQPSNNQLVTLTTERLKVLKVIGENIGQVVVENTAEINAVKIDRIIASVKDVTDHVFTNKIVKQGTIHKQVFFVDPNGIVREVNENVPFMLAVDIAGVERDNPFLEIENKVLSIETDFELTPAKHHEHEHECEHERALLKQKIVAHFLVKVSEWTQLDVVVKPNFLGTINPMNTIVIRNQ
jgi:hypothetical protein